MTTTTASPIHTAAARGVMSSAVVAPKLLKAKKALQGSGDARAS